MSFRWGDAVGVGWLAEGCELAEYVGFVVGEFHCVSFPCTCKHSMLHAATRGVMENPPRRQISEGVRVRTTRRTFA